MACYCFAALEAGFKDSNRSHSLLNFLGQNSTTHLSRSTLTCKVLAELEFIDSPACHSSGIESSLK